MPTPTTATDGFGSTDSALKLQIPDAAKQPPQSEFNVRDHNKSSEQRATDEAAKLPIPAGYKILIIPETGPTVSKGGIHFADSTQKTEALAGIVGYVAKLGQQAYTDTDKFPNGPWCKEGDYILFGRYAGAKVTMHGEKQNQDLNLRILNDDEVIATIDNPQDYIGVS